MIPNYTTVIGVDARHLQQLATVYPTWVRHKPKTILDHPMVIFYDQSQVEMRQVEKAIKHSRLTIVPWPPEGIEYEGDTETKWYHPQRYKMLAGYVHVPRHVVKTPYWFKIDTDSVAIGNDDWIKPEWFEDEPAIIGHGWSFTKPPDQMMLLDKWVKNHEEKLSILAAFPSLDLVPKLGASRLGHKRIASWCAFFNTKFTDSCSRLANMSCGWHQMPVPSQDGFLWYCAKRMRQGIVRTNMKSRGWQCWNSDKNVSKAVEKAMAAPCGASEP